MTKARDLANASTALSAVSATELAFVDGVTSAIQTQMDAKLATATAASTYIPKTLTSTTGDIIYASGANTPARLGIGTTDQVLKVTAGVPAWGAAGSGALTLISTQTISDVASVIFDDVFTSTYTNYLLVYHEVRGTSGTPTVDLYLRLRYAGPTTATTNYWYGLSGVNSTPTALSAGATSQSQATLSRFVGSTGSYHNQGHMFINGAGSGTFVSGVGQNNDMYGEEFLSTFFYQTSSRTYLGFIINASSGNIGGTFSLYGLAK